jgi:hypothetical protein
MKGGETANSFLEKRPPSPWPLEDVVHSDDLAFYRSLTWQRKPSQGLNP